MKRTIYLISMFVVFATTVSAQSPDNANLQFLCGAPGDDGVQRPELKITYDSREPKVGLNDANATAPNYGLYRIEEADSPRMHVVPLTISVTGTGPGSNRVVLRTKELSCPGTATTGPVPPGSYILEITAAALKDDRTDKTIPLKPVDVPFKVGTATVTVAGNVFLQHREVSVHSDVPLASTSFQNLEAERETLRLTPGNDIKDDFRPMKAVYAAQEKSKKPDFLLPLRISDGKQYQVRFKSGLRDVLGDPVSADGSFKLPEVPKNDDDAKISGKLNTVAAVHQTAVLELSGKFAPLHRYYDRENRTIYLDPSVTVDVGLHSTKAANSVIFSGLFRDIITRCTGSGDKDCQPQPKCVKSADADATLGTYQSWTRTPAFCLSEVRFAFGPRFETDRDFQRINTLGEARFDLDFWRLIGAIGDKRAMILGDLKNSAKYRAKADLLEGPDFGFSFLPYVEFDAGGHVNQETVTNSKAKTSLEVPRHGIFRVYAGGVAKFEYKRASLKLDFAMIEMATEEEIGVVTSTGVALRRVTGIQPHSLASLDFGMDPARHYVLSFSYENGRAAPNFEYLSKFASGIKVIY
jgi:hypothetical protein